jgi:DNA-binding protein HU-beta
MTKVELINTLATQADLSKAQAERVLQALVNITTTELKNGNEALLPGIGKLRVTDRAARTGRNPQTGAPVEIPASKAVKFKAASSLKDAVA